MAVSYLIVQGSRFARQRSCARRTKLPFVSVIIAALVLLIATGPAAAQTNHAPVATAPGAPATSVAFDQSTDELLRTTNLPPITGFTMMGWFKLNADPPSYSTLMALAPTSGTNGYFTMMCCGGGWRQVMAYNGSGWALGSTLSLGTWYHLAMTVSGTGPGQFRVYLNGVLDVTIDGTPAALSQRLSIANDIQHNAFPGSAASVKVYNAVLSPSEIAQEMQSYLPVRTADLNSWYPARTAADAKSDYSGNVRTLTVGGTLTTDASGPPLASGTAVITNEDTPVSGTLQATDPDGNPLTYAVVSNGSKGVATITNASTGAFTYTPTPHANGWDSFTFKANDGALDSNIATVTVLITPWNVQPPVASNGTLAVVRDQVTAGTLVATDPANLPLTYSIVSNATLGMVTITNASTGAFTYAPQAGVTGLDTFMFQASNGTRVSNVATVTVTISPPVNHPPVALPAGTPPTAVAFDASTDELRRTTNLPPVTGFTMMGWFRLAGDNHSYTTMLGLSQATSSNAYLAMMCCGSGWRQFGVWNGNSLVLGSQLTLGTWYHVAITVSGSGPGQVHAYLNGHLDITADGNPAITADRLSIGNDSHAEWMQGSAASVKVYDAVLSATEIGQEMQAYAPVRTANLNSWYPLETSSDARTDYSGNVRTLTVGGTLTTDSSGPPLASGIALITNEDTPVGGTLQATDPDGDPVTYALVSNASLGTVSLIDPSTGAFTYTPIPHANGWDKFTFKANDGKIDSNVATVTVLITPWAVQPPVASDATLSVVRDRTAAGTLVATDPASLPLTYTLVSNATLGTVTITNASTGAFTYTPQAGVTGLDTFTFRASNGTRLSNIATVTVTIAPPVNHPPVALPSGSAPTGVTFDASTDELRRTTNLPPITGFTMMGWFRFNGDSHSYSTMLALGQPTSSNAYVVQMCCGNGWRQLELWTGAQIAMGSTLTLGTWYHVAVTVAGTGPGQVKAYLNGKLDLTLDGNPAVTSDRFSIGNDAHAEWLDGNAAAVKVYDAVLTPGEIAQEMQSYVPMRTAALNNWYPLISATDAVTDYSGNAGTLTASGSLLTATGPPLASGLAFVTATNTAASGTLQANDPDGDPLTYVIVSGPSQGFVTITDPSTGAFTYTPNANATGTDTFTFKVNDGALDSGVMTVTILIKSH